MANRQVIIAICLFASTLQISQSILVGNSTEGQKNGDNKELDRAAGSGKELDTNSSFYYEADSYLLDDSKPNSKSKSQNMTRDSLSAGESNSEDESNMKPASIAMTSARNGRMLDLDALVGDFAASKANAERHQTGNRQSRFLTSSGLDSIGAKKQLQIQGFIPIIGVKDLAEDDASGHQRPNESPASSSRYQQQLLQQQLSHELPYAQSSIGHATFPTQRYLNTDPYPSNNDLSPQASHQLTDSYKRPIRKMSGFSSTQPDSNQLQAGATSQASRQNCLCVPFYSCKNGYISESSLGKTQIQQMIAQQQQQQVSALGQHAEIRQSPTLRSGTVESVPIQAAPLIDERSLDREIVTAAPTTTSFENGQASVNQTIDFSAEASLNSGDLNQAALASLMDDPSKLNATLASNVSNDYSQEILGRMLGLGSNSKLSQQQSAAFGSCGLLRTCCNVPLHLFPSQQDLANEKLMSQYGSSDSSINTVNKYLNQRANGMSMQQSNDIASLPSQHQANYVQHQLQQFTQPMSHQSNKVPYGLPSLRSQALQPLNTFNNPSDGLLAHRSTLHAAQLALARPHNNLLQSQPSQQQIAQYTRAISSTQPIQSFTQPIQQYQGNQQQLYQQQLAKSLTPMTPMASSSSRQSSLTPAQYLSQLSAHQPQQLLPPQVNTNLQTAGSHVHPQQLSPSIGTRKILDGRCGLRNSAGITGRVQNLQYHESSADFGEYPAQAAILKRLSGSDNLFVCGGTLISQYWVATAAHCIKKHSQSDLKVRLGEWDVHRDDEFYPYVEKEIRDLIIHPEFVAGNLINDIALLRLDSPVDPSLPHVNPACLPTIDETFDRQHCSVTGWGKDSFGQKGSFQAVLREVDLPVVGHQECEQALRSTRLGPHYRLHSGFICAGGEGGKDACEGDGGSGLYCSQNGVIKVVGLVSWGIGCGQAGVPGVYVNMAHYRPWIENIISIDEDIYSPYNNVLSNTLISERSNGNSSNTSPNTGPTGNNDVAPGSSTSTTERPTNAGDT